jgi:isopentenyl-diphosphate delta-isomerase
MSTTTVVTEPAQAEYASIDLSSYDAEQAKLMEERCILVDGNDVAYGASDKKTCASDVSTPLFA